MMGVIAIRAAHNHRPCHPFVAKFAMRALATRDRGKTRLDEVGNQWRILRGISYS